MDCSGAGRDPSATQTLAKSPTKYIDGAAPKYLARGKGCRVCDVDGNEYIDLVMGIGTLVLGYGNDAVDRAIRYQIEQGINFSLMHPLEVEVAELVAELVPGAEMVRFSKTGADVTSAAVRLARAFTGRGKVLCCGYHGWHDWYIGTTPRNGGIPAEVSALVQRFAYNDIESLAAKLDDDTACVHDGEHSLSCPVLLAVWISPAIWRSSVFRRCENRHFLAEFKSVRR